METQFTCKLCTPKMVDPSLDLIAENYTALN